VPALQCRHAPAGPPPATTGGRCLKVPPVSPLPCPLASTVRAFLEARHRQHGGAGPLADDPAVFDGRLLDSLALAELVTLVEARCGQPVDMLLFDPLAVETASDLVRELKRAIGAGGGAGA
jgi:hypothetical protein